jgi:hypothetical protein
MRSLTGRFRRHYGAHPLHLLTLLASFALVGYVIATVGPKQLWNSHVWWQSIAVWFIAAIILHDLVLFPFYALADRSLGAGWRAVTGRFPDRMPRVPPVNYLRIPTMASGLLLLMFFPGIIEQGKGAYLRATGLTQAPFLDRWLLITAVLFGSSALAYGIRLVVVRRRRPARVPSSGQGDGVEYV